MSDNLTELQKDVLALANKKSLQGDNLFDIYQELAQATAIYDKSKFPDYSFLKLTEEAGEVSGLLGKLQRDEAGEKSAEFVNKLKKELGDVLWYVSDIAKNHGITLSEVAMSNLDKLYDRFDRGVIGGSGSDR